MLAMYGASRKHTPPRLKLTAAAATPPSHTPVAACVASEPSTTGAESSAALPLTTNQQPLTSPLLAESMKVSQGLVGILAAGRSSRLTTCAWLCVFSATSVCVCVPHAA